MEKLSFEDFVERVKAVDYAVGIEGQTYRCVSCDDEYYFGIRGTAFKINLHKLYEAYLTCRLINTSTLKEYVNGVQSPSYAILKKAGLL